MQNKINKYFAKLATSEFFQNDDESIVGKAKDVIKNLKQQSEYVNNKKNNVDKEEIDFITNEVNNLIKNIQNMYSNENDVIKLSFHPMLGFYTLVDSKLLFEELRNYYSELEEN